MGRRKAFAVFGPLCPLSTLFPSVDLRLVSYLIRQWAGLWVSGGERGVRGLISGSYLPSHVGRAAPSSPRQSLHVPVASSGPEIGLALCYHLWVPIPCPLVNRYVIKCLF